MPTVSLLAAPGPDPSISGRTPMIVDKLVIKIGLSRIVAALAIALALFWPDICNLLANSVISIPCLLTKPTSVNKPICV